jgi:hypothetical protein
LLLVLLRDSALAIQSGDLATDAHHEGVDLIQRRLGGELLVDVSDGIKVWRVQSIFSEVAEPAMARG